MGIIGFSVAKLVEGDVPGIASFQEVGAALSMKLGFFRSLIRLFR